jgi:2-hydroxy-4-carboxymuconate semialdehyde hemiacetal dehydrogenase
MKICLAGEGAMGTNHMKALRAIDGVEVVTLAGGIEADAAAFAKEWQIPHYALDLKACLERPGVEAVLLATPNQIHAEQAMLALGMGKHVLVEIPMALTLADSERLAAMEEKSGLVCMVCHTKRYSSDYREIQRQVRGGELHLYHIVQETYFFRRTNTNMFGKPRTWADQLLWHQACHMVDMVYWLFEEPEMEVWGQAGPDHPRLGVPMDMTIGMRSRGGCLVTGAYSFNNHGPITGRTRFIGEEATLLTGKGGLTDHEGNALPLPPERGIELQDREFFDAIQEGRKPLTSCAACLPTMRLLDRIQRTMDGQR